ncbi:MAG: hypothetical protein DMD79_25910, partial [Candidatus Rokuibacteriota bacterium]
VTRSPRLRGSRSYSTAVARNGDLSRRALLAATVPDAGAFERLVAGHAPEIDWAWLIERASVHKVAALLATRLARLGVERDFPDPVRRQLDTIRRRAAERAGHAARTLREVASALEARDIPVFVIKGSVLAEHVYGDPDVRPFDDVDLVIPKTMMGPAEAALLSLGYALYPVRVKSFQFAPPGGTVPTTSTSPSRRPGATRDSRWSFTGTWRCLVSSGSRIASCGRAPPPRSSPGDRCAPSTPQPPSFTSPCTPWRAGPPRSGCSTWPISSGSSPDLRRATAGTTSGTSRRAGAPSTT